jgi:hypothetical protein
VIDLHPYGFKVVTIIGAFCNPHPRINQGRRSHRRFATAGGSSAFIKKLLIIV